VATVNPPPRLRPPKALIKDAESLAWFEQVNTILFQLYTRTGGGEDVVNLDSDRITELENQIGEDFNSFTQQLFKESQGLPEFTIDTTGFTTDTTFITTDKVIA
jgi:hypothetical protein